MGTSAIFPAGLVRRAHIAILCCGACNGVIGGFGTGGGSVGASSGTGTTGSSTTTSSTGGTTGAVSLYLPVTPAAYVPKVKDLLTGFPATDAEVAAVEADAGALAGLVADWISADVDGGYQGKMLDFFESVFQQDTPDAGAFGPQGDTFAGPQQALLLQDFRQSFARTAWALSQAGSFAATMTTTSFMLSPALMAHYARIDSRIAPDDGGAPIELYEQANPGLAYAVTAQTTVPLQSSLDPDSGSFLTFDCPELAAQPAGCTTDPRTYDAATVSGQSVSESLFTFLFGQLNAFLLPDGGVCPALPQVASPYVQPADYTSWAMVQVRPPDAGETATRFYDLLTLRALGADGGALLLDLPRVGFFTTPAFLARWPTNASNAARVTTDQTLIVGLDHAFDGSESTPPPDGGLAALSAATPPGSSCFACHEDLDPMRQFFRQSYSLSFTAQNDPLEIALPGVFAFDGVSTFGASIGDLGTALAEHPTFATAWTQKLCTYASSAACDESDPEFQRLVQVFQSSNYSWNALVAAVFSSPLVTYAVDTRTADVLGDQVPLTRREHLCARLSNRLGLPDVCGLSAAAAPSTAQSLMSDYPADGYTRGEAPPLQPAVPELFTSAALESLCAQVALLAVDGEGPYSSASASTQQAAIADLATQLMGLTSERSGPALALLQQHFAAALDAGADVGELGDGGGITVTASDALRSTFIVACESPYLAGVGL